MGFQRGLGGLVARTAVCRLSRCSSARGLFKEEESPKRTRAAQGPAWPPGRPLRGKGVRIVYQGCPLPSLCYWFTAASRHVNARQWLFQGEQSNRSTMGRKMKTSAVEDMSADRT